MGNQIVSLKIPQWEDMDFIRRMWADPETMAPVGGPVRLNDEEAARWYAAKIAPGGQQDRYRLILDPNGKPIGEISYHRMDLGAMTAEFNIKVLHSERRRGYGRAAMIMFLDEFFNQIGGQVMNDDLALENRAGQQALLEFGFKHVPAEEKVFRMRLTKSGFNALYGSSK